ncbi:hemerythrin domain-containing protein [Brevibacillus humidisoli]|uniref:hemerythrin domain-containing protein n=1 Tax=Brevibacillus humidisoli TaxID=2895522 RepID=UPI001E2F5713|nr:hemerythrin domain-containing protein [Brevibacillus humidisoli]UFJ41761.1 hemerythrin domain-containing protein [Brevibacillus humidisoli]
MNQIPHCGMMAGQGEQVRLCKALAQLKREHGPLRAQMDAFADEAAVVDKDQAETDWGKRLWLLREKVDAFVQELEPHSEREEGTLFPLMAKYIGWQGGPIAVMEHEHELAKRYLKMFLEAVEQLKEPVDAARAKEIASYALQAHAVLTDHFMKEENVLFPMAENMLNTEEKEELNRAFGLS